ncbi:MAG: thioredoxin domain-containing protein [Acidobacteria bacterium]|jgi:hypothetical protein|nr:thioredoxin domain-containing protein [Acidobacteriota bacterium]
MSEGRNRLGAEKSPYLLQHRDNPVWWYAWGPEAFAAAAARDCPVFLSIGYSTCHWCHVMEHQSFEDPAVAAVLNDGFVAIKLDREERPEIDAIYMEVTQALTGHGGWPMSVWLTPEGRPFFAGTYFPRDAFVDLLQRIGAAWRTRRVEIEAQGRALAEAVRERAGAGQAGALDDGVLRGFVDGWRGRFDPRHGGTRGAPKFPHAWDLQLLLRAHRRGGDPFALEVVTKTLDGMARGGIYDHLGGGFARYSVDEAWFAPHFEKMLYDQASLATAYTEAWQVTGRREYELVAREILDYVLRDLASPGGGFCSAEDADSEGIEGKFYVWTWDELAALLPEDGFRAVVEAFGVARHGNWEHGANILHLAPGQERATRPPQLAAAMARLFEARARRVRPHLDDKVLADWNGLAIAALARAGRAFGEPRFVAAAQRAARFVLASMRRPDGALWHRWRDGEAGIPGLLDDHAFVVHGLVELYQADFDPAWLDAAEALQASQDALFREGDDYLVHDGSDPLVIARRVEPLDNVVPAGRSVTALNLLRLGDLAARPEWREQGLALLAASPAAVRRAPGAFAVLLQALDYALDRGRQVAITGALDADDTRAMLAALTGGFRPNQVTAAGPGGADARPGLLAGRTAREGRATAFVCEAGACQAPTTDPVEAARAAAGFAPLAG